MTTTKYELPIPEADAESAPFFDGLRRHELVLMRCRSCGAWRLPSRPRCPDCWSTDTEWATASGHATLYSWGIMHQKLHPAFAERVPYQFAIVELGEGPRIVSNVTGVDDSALRIGMPLHAVYEDVAEDATMLRFALDGA